jgi:hypothetical protein
MNIVFIVIIVIVAALLAYLVFLDIRLRRVERKTNDQSK